MSIRKQGEIMKNNKGFSLVEAIVAFAIASIAALSVFGFMVFGNSSFKSTSTDVGLQYEQQIVVNQVRDLILESTNALSNGAVSGEGAVIPDKSQLIIYNTTKTSSGTAAYEATRITFESEDSAESGTIYKNSLVFDDISSVDVNSFDDDLNRILGENVSDIEFDLSEVDDGKVSFTIEFTNNGKSIKSKQIVSLRNNVVNSDDVNDIFVSETKYLNSFIDYVEILKNGVLIKNDSIAKAGDNDIYVDYTAKAVGKKYSEFDYSVDWSIIKSEADKDLNISVSAGRVKIASDVPAGTVFELRATSVDDRSKYASVMITVEADGIYPTAVHMFTKTSEEDPDNPKYIISEWGAKEYNGIYAYIEYYDYAEKKVLYGSEQKVLDNTKFTWEVKSDELALDKYCIFNSNGYTDPDTNSTYGQLRITSPNVNGHVVTVKASTKLLGVDGKPVTAALNFNIDGVKEYQSGQYLTITGTNVKYNVRGNTTFVTVAWSQMVTDNYIYHWNIEPINPSKEDDFGAWNTGKAKTNFSDIVQIIDEKGNEQGQSYDTPDYRSYLEIYCKNYLDWSNTMKFKVTCWAEECDSDGTPKRNGKKYYGKDSTVDNPIPASTIVEFEPVKLILKPASVINKSDNDKYYFETGRVLKNTGSNYTKREFEMEMVGLDLSWNNDNNSNNMWQNIDITYKMNFYDVAGKNVVGLPYKHMLTHMESGYDIAIFDWTYSKSSNPKSCKYAGFNLIYNSGWNKLMEQQYVKDTKYFSFIATIKDSKYDNAVDSMTMYQGTNYLDDTNLISSYQYLYEWETDGKITEPSH